MPQTETNLGRKDDAMKSDVQSFWNAESCGEIFATGSQIDEQFKNVLESRYRVDPFLPGWAKFEEGKGKKVLEIGVGMGSDHYMWAMSEPKELYGVDLTERAIENTKKRFETFGLKSNLQTADAENLPFKDNSFDIVYSFGVLHHTPNTPQAIQEVYRVLKPGGTAKIMVYHVYALSSYLLWFRHALLKGKPFQGVRKVCFEHLESPGTKVYHTNEVPSLFPNFSKVEHEIHQCSGDLMIIDDVQKEKGSKAFQLLSKIWPRWFFKRFMKNHGLFLMVTATK